MAIKSKIEWTDATWNPVVGCSHVSEGCRNCYAERMDRRFRKDWKPWTKANASHNARLELHKLTEPMHWRKPRRVFVCSMSDLFHERVPGYVIHDIFATMAVTRRHTYMILTKRARRMHEFLNNSYFPDGFREDYGDGLQWPLPNVWLGVSAETQERLDDRVELLLRTPAAVRFVSLEPLLGCVSLRQAWRDYLVGRETETDKHGEPVPVWTPRLDWVIAGGESGPGARPMFPMWVRQVRDECVSAGVPFFFKQWGAWAPAPLPDAWASTGGMIRVGKRMAGRELDGRTWEEMPR